MADSQRICTSSRPFPKINESAAPGPENEHMTTASKPTVVRGRRSGWDSLTMSNALVRVVVLPDKGADIYSIVDCATGIDVLFKTPWGLQPPGAAPRAGTEGAQFLGNYEGAWQELLPNTNDACTVAGVDYPFHGEVATRGWTANIEKSSGEVSVRLSVDCSLVPLHLERNMRLCAGEPTLYLDERITNRGDTEVSFVWGHHLVLGAPLVGAGARMSVPCRTLVTPDPPWEGTARLEPGQSNRWPLARLRDGTLVDLSAIPGPDFGAHDDVYLTDLDAGWATVWNPGIGLGFALGFDPQIFRWLISWQPFGGARALPLTGSYGLGLEPWVAGGNLEHAIRTSTALSLPAHEVLSTQLVASLIHEDPDVTGWPPGGPGVR